MLYKKMKVTETERKAIVDRQATNFLMYDILKRIEIERGATIGLYRLYGGAQ